MILSFIQQTQNLPGTPLMPVLFVLVFILVGALLYNVYHKWIVPPKVKESKEYNDKKYKDIDGC